MRLPVALALLCACPSVEPFMRDATVADADTDASSDASADASIDASIDTSNDVVNIDASDASAPRGRGMWMWEWTYVGVAAREAELFAFARERNVSILYVESERLVVEDPELLAEFIARADAEGIAVELLFGNPEWAREANHDQLLTLVGESIRLAADAPVPPRGIHLDVEPYVLDDWNPDPTALASGLVDLIASVAEALRDTELELSVDVPFWFDTVRVEGGAEDGVLSELLTDRVDRLVVLAYRDHATGADSIEEISADELAYASSTGALVVVAVETTCGLEPEKITFCEEGNAVLESELEAFETDEPSFDGFAVHSYGAWRALSGATP